MTGLDLPPCNGKNQESPLSSGRSTPTRPLSASSTGSNRLSGKPMGAKKLLEATEKIYKSFNPAQVTLDTHADKALGDMMIYNSFDDTFIRQVLYGVVRYRQFLSSLMDSFYHYNSGVANREDIDMYKLYAYITIFRLEELGFANFRRLVDASEPQKMVVFYRYMFNENFLKQAIRDDWLKLYDKEFVDETIARLLSFEPDMSLLLDELEEKVYLTKKKSEDKESSSSPAGRAVVKGLTTTVEPFKLSNPRPKPLPAEPPAPEPLRARPAPKHRDGPTREEAAIAAAKELNSKVVKEKYAKAAPFKLRVSERPMHLDKIRVDIEADIARQLTFQPPPARPVPAAPAATVKLNAAAILREDAVYRRKQQDEANTLKAFEAELRDASQFKQWQASMLSKDEASRQASIERRRRLMSDAQGAAVRARQHKVEENLTVGREMKAAAQKIEEGLAQEREQAKQANQARREVVQEARANIAVAQEKMLADRRQAADHERHTQTQHAKEVAEAEIRSMAERRDIIMQLRALEKAPRQRVAEFDPTTTPDHGLLDQMSLVELQERLAVAKMRKQQEEEYQRSLIMEHKRKTEALLLEKAANVQRLRKAAAAQAQTRRVQAKSEAALVAEKAVSRHERDALDLHSKLEAKHVARATEAAWLAAEEKKIRFEQMQQAASASAVEETKFKELRDGAHREAIARQTNHLAAASLSEATKSKARTIQLHNMQQTLKAKQDFLAAYDAKLAELAKVAETDAVAQSTKHSQLASKQHAAEVQQQKRHALGAYVPR